MAKLIAARAVHSVGLGRGMPLLVSASQTSGNRAQAVDCAAILLLPQCTSVPLVRSSIVHARCAATHGASAAGLLSLKVVPELLRL